MGRRNEMKTEKLKNYKVSEKRTNERKKGRRNVIIILLVFSSSFFSSSRIIITIIISINIKKNFQLRIF